MNVLTLGARVIGPSRRSNARSRSSARRSAASRATGGGSAKVLAIEAERAADRRAWTPCVGRVRRRRRLAPHPRRRTMDAPSFGGHDDRPRLDRRSPLPASPSATATPPTTRPSSAPGPRTGRTACSIATSRSGRPTRGSARPSPTGSAGSMRRPTSPTRSPASRASATRSWTRATRRRSSPGWAAAASRPDVLHRTFGSQEGYLALRILDSTDPAYVSATLDDLDPLRTLVIIASKSGTTTEPNAFLADAWARAEAALEAVAHHTLRAPRARSSRPITDPGKSVEAHRPPRRLPRGLPQPARHRRPVFGADLRRARAGVAHRARPRRAAGVGARRCSAPAASRTRRPTRASRSGWPSGPSPRPAATS